MSGKAHRIMSLVRSNSAAFGPEADISRQTRVAGAVENDPEATLRHGTKDDVGCAHCLRFRFLSGLSRIPKRPPKGFGAII